MKIFRRGPGPRVKTNGLQAILFLLLLMAVVLSSSGCAGVVGAQLVLTRLSETGAGGDLIRLAQWNVSVALFNHFGGNRWHSSVCMASHERQFAYRINHFEFWCDLWNTDTKRCISFHCSSYRFQFAGGDR